MSLLHIHAARAQMRWWLSPLLIAFEFSTASAYLNSGTCDQGQQGCLRQAVASQQGTLSNQEATVEVYEDNSEQTLHLLQTHMSIARPLASSQQQAGIGTTRNSSTAHSQIETNTSGGDSTNLSSLVQSNVTDVHVKTHEARATELAHESSFAKIAKSMLQKVIQLQSKPKRKKKKKMDDDSDEEIQTKAHGGTHGEDRWVLVVSGLVVSMFYVAASLYLSCRDVRKASDSFTSSRSILGDIREDPEHKEKSVEKLDEDTSGLLIFSIIEDGRVLAGSSGPKFLRISRVVQALCLQAFTMFIQITSLYYIKWFCSAKSVFEIRKYYDQYELHMVGDNASLTTVTINGGHRALDQYFNESYFHTLEAEVQEKVCDIPLSQPNFFMIVLFLWSLTCILDFRRCLDYYLALMMTTPSIKSMKDAVVTEEEGSKVVVGITVMVKHIIFWLVLVPRFLLAAFMLWLGCRWLAATVDFADLILNACALEFLLCLRGLLYNALVPEHTKIDIQKTDIRIPITRHKASVFTFLSSGSWGVMAFIWIWVYMFKLQTVLPEYRWDVRAPCTEWMSERYW
eukprot:gnl/TRDRNA2_/TRDRNA2_162986_c0_seq3.p1 gnl/TRDRNA2_/TRDRNA2_162986_c0~~gnl/TRDRNA2_/TRDRNA2_162986_c0_seq3.p1  ORF type:complete len:569 (+),score=99.30 gnl/TRDRNA2_/TRDRNA2_162986_c0_seq3:84-1790(+)